MTSNNILAIRLALKAMNPGEMSWKADKPPVVDQIFTPSDHDGTLDPDRAVVVGNRGVGKSYWSAVLAHKELRDAVSGRYPKLGLSNLTVKLGFHEAAADGLDDLAPSKSTLTQLEKNGYSALNIWRGVLIEALRTTDRSVAAQLPPPGLTAAVAWVATCPEAFEAVLRTANATFQQRGQKFVLLFDALDRLGDDWKDIRRRTDGIMRLALQLRSSRTLRAKVFMRSDQFSDQRVFSFPDASKLKQESVPLTWRRRDLYGLLFQRLWFASRPAFIQLLTERTEIRPSAKNTNFPPLIIDNEGIQAEIFYAIAGEFMGSDFRKGRTYSWLHDHLADAAGETSPRSFLYAIRKAAANAQGSEQIITHRDLHVGVQDASEIRLDQLKEDYWWVVNAIDALKGLLVPCEPGEFLGRWRERETIKGILQEAKSGKKLPPLQLADNPADAESRLLEELSHINVVEKRTNGKINMPDIFRVAAGIKRRGGVRPPVSPGRR